ncbi:LAETG motif-containing sortase-dependent surface protein [Streptomyces sp. NPDC001922]|uniref:LAETG motif-containing sortase-dependent surface protein n=1 Tax=Streptomyces sp. NPDC001922 TaxID=3364624 RepID=UPI00369DECBB
MMLRRALATAAATAAIVPAALLAAPSAFATDGGETPDPAASTSTAPAPESSTSTAPAPEGSTSSAPAPASSSSSAPAPAGSAPSSSSSATTGATDKPSATATTGTRPTAGSTDGPLECDESDEPQIDDSLVTGFSGLPSKIVAGSGFHRFRLDVSNASDSAYQRVDLGVFAAQIDEDTWGVGSGHLTLQYRDPESGAWQNISLNENDEGAGYVGYTDVRPHESFSVDLRLSVDASAPAGLGFAISIGAYANDKGECVYASGKSYYEFDILAAGSKPGEIPSAEPKPQGGRKPVPAKPAGNTAIDPKGHLAETGASSLLPTIATVGGVAMVVGAGAVFVVRRRRTEGPVSAA